MSIVFSELYSKAALFIYSCGLEVTKDNMKKIFEQMGVEFHPKIAEMFIFPTEKYDELISAVSSQPAVAVSGGAQVADGKEEAQKEEEKEEEDVNVDFGDLFG